MTSPGARLANQCRCGYYLAHSLSDMLSMYSDEGHSIVVKMPVKDTVWPEILAGNLFWRIGGFESNPPIFHPPKTSQCHSLCTSGSYIRQSNRRHGVYH